LLTPETAIAPTGNWKKDGKAIGDTKNAKATTLLSVTAVGSATNLISKTNNKIDKKTDKEVYKPKDKNGKTIKTEKSNAGNTKIDKEAKGRAHTQLREDKSGNYPQRTTFDSKGRKRADTHFTTHGEKNKSNPHKHTYYKNGARSKNKTDN